MRNNGDWLRLRKEFQAELNQGSITLRQFVEKKGIDLHDRGLLSLLNVAAMHAFRNGEMFDVDSMIRDFPRFSDASIRATASRAQKVMAECYCPLTDLGCRTIGDKIELNDELFRDSTGVVYSAKSSEHERPLEAKLNFPCAGPVPDQLATLKKIGHPGIFPLVEFGTVMNRDYVLQERPRGVTLRSLCRYPAKITQIQAVEIFVDILDAVDHCHCMGLVFRRIVPEHILICKGKPVISNFELALAVKGSISDDSDDPYAQVVSPVASNISKLGVLFHQILTGIHPIRFDNDRRYFRYPSEYRDDLDPELEKICLNAISDSMSNQFKSARQFKQSLDTWWAGNSHSETTKAPHFGQQHRTHRVDGD